MKKETPYFILALICFFGFVLVMAQLCLPNGPIIQGMNAMAAASGIGTLGTIFVFVHKRVRDGYILFPN